MSETGNPLANPQVVLREEFDDWAILFDPDSGRGFGLNPVSVFVWKRLDGRHSEEDILEELKKKFDNVPEDARSHVRDFVRDLWHRGLVGYEVGDF